MSMHLRRFPMIRCLILSFLLQVIAFLAIFSCAEELDKFSTDEEVAFRVGEGQQPMNVQVASTSTSQSQDSQEGYVVYCPCMGRFGNQGSQFLGSLAFAKGLNRTLVLPPWIVYPSTRLGQSMRIRFNSWFQVKPLQKYHRVITMEKFMKDLAPTVWPPGKRIGFCYDFHSKTNKCSMKKGNPFGPFWDHFNIDFDEYRQHIGLAWDMEDPSDRDGWQERFPVKDYPVIALMGSPGSFPCDKRNRWLQKFVKFSTKIKKKADKFIKEVLPKGPFVGIHLRNGNDFKRACALVNETNMLFASPQCIDMFSSKKLTFEMCYPSEKEIIERVKETVKAVKANSVFVATDDNPMLPKLTEALKEHKVTVHRRKEEDEISDPIVDLAILSSADHFIGNCVSSFTAFAKRMRDVNSKPSSFWAFDE